MRARDGAKGVGFPDSGEAQEVGNVVLIRAPGIWILDVREPFGVLTTADQPSARIFADRLRQNIRANTTGVTPTPPWAPASVSIGVATMPADGQTLDALIHVADQRLYDAKRRGGDAVVDGATTVS